ncbi:hypothetical protein ORI20_16400 [Mycobacterium sp. CVI_P3]|uniref:Uncharacterized protein n=1 Tax=Mycobacterium pinniadriaticum TaxID=2994102 RepID=A0ABT3SFN8_9MYCO|nr:hypothetical protein [Mycobacterium pinniadriaticum]MCX2931864.1 hypothetical protein [Mycobacterium pinniadriaticum]MCX2938325.1 hypothetical protein [Mycobacterium pinniadriaticum]
MTDQVESLLAQLDPELSPPISRRDVVLVAGPWLAGTSSLVAALRARLPGQRVLEPGELGPGEAPTAVVFVVSATAPLADSDCALLDVVAADTDALIGVVSKIDVHRTWREVLDADRALVTRWAPRYADVPWVGVAAAPDLGPPAVDDLVAILSTTLADGALHQRNSLRAWENRLLAAAQRLDRDVEDADREAKLAALCEHRARVLHRFRVDRAERTIALRSRIQQARVQLSSFVRSRCADARIELKDDVAAMTRRRLGGFTDEVRRRVAEVSDEVNEEVGHQLVDLGEQLGLAIQTPAEPAPVIEVGAAPPRAGSAETRLTMLLGAGFGLGVALTVNRLSAGLAPQWTATGVVAAVVAGLAVTAWLVGVRVLLHDRVVLDRWAGEVVAGLRAALEEWVVTCVLAAEAAVGRAAAERDAVASAEFDDAVARIDREIRAHMAQRTRAAAVRDRRGEAILRALTAVRRRIQAMKRPIVAF